MKTKAFRKIAGTFAILALALGAGVAIRSVSAGTETGYGWLWGGGAEVDGVAPWDGTNTGVRWISMNNVSSGDAISYGVNIPSSGAISGYAWGGGDVSGSGIGWIDFDSPTHCVVPPVVPNAVQQQYQAATCTDPSGGSGGVQRIGDDLVGFARVVSVAQASVSGNAGGWDGWVSLGKNANDKVSIDTSTNKLLGSAWSTEFGWIDMSGASIGAVSASALEICIDDGTGTFIPIASGDGDTFTLQQMEIGNTKTLKAFYDNDGIACAGSDITATAGWNGTLNNPNDAVTVVSGIVTAIANGTESFTVSSSGQTITGTVTVAPIVPPCSSCNDEKAQHCPTETWMSGCGANCAAGTGTRYCDFNWKEVAPGQ
jgi:hypothetical protein